MGNKAAVWLLSTALVVIYLVVFLTVGYGGLVLVYVVLALLGSAGLIIARYVIKQEATVVLRGVGVDYALRTAGHALHVIEDNLVGFPSGKFEPAAGSAPNSIEAHEFKPRGGHRIALSMVMVPWIISGAIIITVARAFDSGWAYFIGQGMRVMAFIYFVFFLIVPMLLALLIELGLKQVVASVITVQAEEVDDAVRLTFAFRGASALLVKARLLSSFDAPVLPLKYQTTRTASPAAQSNEVAA